MEAIVVRKQTFCAWLVFLLAPVAFITSGQEAAGQTRLYFDGGTWIPFLPDYTAGSIVGPGGAPVIQRDLLADDQIDVGTQLGLTGFHHLNQSSTMLEVDLNIAGIGSMGAAGTFADPGAGQSVWLASLNGAGFISTLDGESATLRLDSDVLHYSEYIGLRDTFATRRLGDVELGVGFGHMGFEQSFQLDALITSGASGQYLEDLDTTYLGGEIRGRLRKNMGDYAILFDFGIGLYDMDADYQGISVLRNTVGAVFDQDQVLLGIDDTAMTLDLAMKIDTQFHGVVMRPGIYFKYISDMPVINHPMTEEVPVPVPVSLDSDPGYFLGVNLEILLCCRNRCCDCCCK